jgi:hypothetical protein
MTPGERAELTRIVERRKAINAQIQDLKWEAKELGEAAWDKCGVKAKVVAQLAKETAWDAVQREERRQFEESLDECRAALGLLADTPLGQAAQAPPVRAVAAHANGNGAVKRGPGRPKGSRNKPKLAVVPEAAAPPPEVPDMADTPEAAV